MDAMILERNAPIDTSPLCRRELPDPEPKPGQVRLSIECCAICRTDLHVIEGDIPLKRSPIIPGHQIIGTVDKVGAGCSTVRVGQRVGVAWLQQTCGKCSYCLGGLENLCETSLYTGYTVDGGYATAMVVSEGFLLNIPQSFGSVQAAPLLCAGIIGYRALMRSQLPRKGTLGIFGFGSSAHIVLQMAKHRGCRVFVVSRGTGHQNHARSMGADWVGTDAQMAPDEFDSAIVFAPEGTLVPKALARLKKGGTLALAGIHMSEIPAMNYEKHLFYEKNVHSVTAFTREDGRQLLQEAEDIPIVPHTTSYPLPEANQALQDLKSDKINGTGVLIMS